MQKVGAFLIKNTECMFLMRYNIWVRPGVTVVTLQDYIHRTTKRVSLKNEWQMGQEATTYVYICLFGSKCICVPMNVTTIVRKVMLAYGFALCRHSDPVTA